MVFSSPLLQLPNTFRAFYGAFPAIHPAQLEAIAPILQGRDLVVQAATGSGKSEAVLAPCMERVIQSGRKLAVLYIIPTRALAVDLRRRFDPVITDRLGLSLAIRTGDVKSTRGKEPNLMFTTPESLDVMLGSSNEDITNFLFRVGSVIIDEVHPLIYHYRGIHLAHLLTRLERRNSRTIQRIAMSATIAHADAVMDAFNFKPHPETCHIKNTVKREILARLIHLKNETKEFPALLNDLHGTWKYDKILVFANSRGACDRLFGIVNRTGPFKGVSELHYSNLKPRERKQAENRFRKNSRALCIATSTLELGIDVGDVDAVLLYEPPDSVSAFLQRIGRANRRQSTLNFWGICQGEKASCQVVRFLALLKLARQGIVESPPKRSLPSVMAQQIISCLYEKKQISLSAMLDLFPDRKTVFSKTAMADLFQSLEKKRWIKKAFVSGLYSGGFQYGRHLTEYKIWGNFPETGEEYILELTRSQGYQFNRSPLSPGRTSPDCNHLSPAPDPRSIADLPRSIVKQMEVGDRVYIAGRRLKILKIDHGDDKRVFAASTNSPPDKDILWLGMGAHVSFEVAQMMRTIVKTTTEPDDPSLLSRTRTLFQGELQKEKTVVLLDNGIEVLPGQKATYLYRTSLGSLGNLVLEWSIRNHIDSKELFVRSHETGVECSCAVKFQNLNLPADRRAFEHWVGSNIQILTSLIPLNLFCKTLPHDLLATEVTDFLFDQRVIDAFIHYMGHSSEVVSGDMAAIESRGVLHGVGNGIPKETHGKTGNGENKENDLPHILDITPGVSLLKQEKKRWFQENRDPAPAATESETEAKAKSGVEAAEVKTEVNSKSGAGAAEVETSRLSCLELNPSGTLTATMVSDYFLHKQCKRRLCFKYLRTAPPDSQLSKQELTLRQEAMNQGLVHEDNVLKALKEEGECILHMPRHNSFTQRFQKFLDTITALSHGADSTTGMDFTDITDFTLPHGVTFSHPSHGLPSSDLSYGDSPSGPLHGASPSPSLHKNHILLSQCLLKLDTTASHRFNIKALGVPDLIVLSGNCNKDGLKITMEVGDIKSSSAPRYHQKWQVAFYALLLKEIIALHNIPAKVSTQGFLMTRSSLALDLSRENSKNRETCQGAVYEKHSFDLTPFMSAFPMLLDNFGTTLTRPPSTADHMLQGHCISCQWFPHCHGNALEKEDIQFLPGLTWGELLKLRRVDLTMMANVHKTLAKSRELPNKENGSVNKAQSNGSVNNAQTPANHPSHLLQDIFSSGQQQKLMGRCDAMLNNRILLHKKRTRLFPANLSALFFIHLINDPVLQTPRALGWLIMDENFKVVETRFRIMENRQEQRAVWLEFAHHISREWNSRILRGKGPHIFHFSPQTRHNLLQWGESVLEHPAMTALSKAEKAEKGEKAKKGDMLQNAGKPTFLWQKQPSMWSDIKKIFMEHFHMPSPGTVSLFTLSHLFGCNHGIEEPETIFHSHGKGYLFSSAAPLSSPAPAAGDGVSPQPSQQALELKSELNSILTTMAALFKTVKPLVESQWIQEWKKTSHAPYPYESGPDSHIPMDSDRGNCIGSGIGIGNDIHAMESHNAAPGLTSRSAFIRFISEERRLKEEDTLDLQELPMQERMEKFRCLGHLTFQHTCMDDEGRCLYVFNTTPQTMPSKFRKGDFLKLVPHGMIDLQNGSSVIISEYDMETGEVSLISRSGRLNPSRTLFYSLEEDIADFTEAKLSHAAEFIFSEPPFHPVNQLLTGGWQQRQHGDSIRWVEKWINSNNSGLNPSQQAALFLPFQYKTSMIQGPPGTGKTHLLAWILISLVMQAFEQGTPLRIGISALTHQAIDNVLTKVVSIVNEQVPEKFPGRSFPGSCIKWGKTATKEKTPGSYRDTVSGLEEKEDNGMAVEFLDDADEVLGRTWSIIGATGFGFYNLFNSRNGEFPQALDWIIFDEASQVLLPQAMLTLIYGRGNFLFLGDVHQLPPIVLGSYDELNHSILSKLMELYEKDHQVTLDITYRMNRGICAFPAEMWYQGRLHPAPVNADSCLQLNRPLHGSGTVHDADGCSPCLDKDKQNRTRHFEKPFDHILDPSKPVVMVLVDHHGCSQQCDMEADLMAGLARELMVHHGLKGEQMALISPHRAQNNAIIKKISRMLSGEEDWTESTAAPESATLGESILKKGEPGQQKFNGTQWSLPLVDTVERVQGAEREVIIFGITSSDPDHILSDFLNSPNRLNVAMTRAKHKLIIIGSRAFFSAIPDNEAMLEKNRCFKALLKHCSDQDALFESPLYDPSKAATLS